MFGDIDWETKTIGFCTCPGIAQHNSPDQRKDCRVHLDGVPNINCFHESCSAIQAAKNYEFQSHIGKEERQQACGRSELPAYYDGVRKAFWTTNSRGDWIEVNEQSLRRLLREQGFRGGKLRDGEAITPLDAKLNQIQREQDVAYAGPLAGYRSGVTDCCGQRILVTTSPVLIEPAEGEWPVLRRFLETLLYDSHYDQMPYVFALLENCV
jgi:hypothetical protein